MSSSGLTTPHPGYPALAAKINETLGLGIPGVRNCGTHNPQFGSNYWKDEGEGELLFYSAVVLTAPKEDDVGSGRNVIFRVTPAKAPPELLC